MAASEYLGNLLKWWVGGISKSTLTHSLLKSPISKLAISRNNISKGSKNSEHLIAFGGIAKYKPLHKTDFSWSFKL